MEVSTITDWWFFLISTFVHLNLLQISKFSMFKNKLMMCHPQKPKVPCSEFPVLFNNLELTYHLKNHDQSSPLLCEMLPSKC